MKNTEINKLLNLLNKNKLEEIKDYLLSEKEKNKSEARQRYFEKYMCNDGKTYSLKYGKGTVMNSRENEIIFSNGISLYYVNKSLFNIDSAKIIKHTDSKKVLPHKYINLVNDKYIKRIENSFNINNLESTFIYPNAIEYIYDKTITISIIDCDDILEKHFLKSEFDQANEILDNPKFKVSSSDPLLYAESNIGKCYILGLNPKK